jgi:hypothetical protein
MLLATDNANHLVPCLCVTTRREALSISAVMRSPMLVATGDAFRLHDNDNNGKGTGPAGNPIYLPAPTFGD